MLLATLFTTAKKIETTQCPSTDEQINKMFYIHTVECYPTLKKKQSTDTCYSIDDYKNIWQMKEAFLYDSIK